MNRLLAVSAALAFVTLALPEQAHAGPPWISIECPANPHDRASRGAEFLIRTYHHTRLVPATLTGSAEGLVNGERRTIPLEFARGMEEGVYYVTTELPQNGAWILVINGMVEQSVASALVQLAQGRVMGVDVPHRTTPDGWKVPRQITAAEVESALRAHVARVARA